MFSNLVHLIMNLNISYPYLILQQTQIAVLTILTVPKTCEVNEKKSKRRTDRYTHTMFVIIYRMANYK